MADFEVNTAEGLPLLVGLIFATSSGYALTPSQVTAAMSSPMWGEQASCHAVRSSNALQETGRQHIAADRARGDPPPQPRQ